MIKAKLAWASILLFIDLIVQPTLQLLGVVGILIALDFVTGVTKAVISKKQRTSEGYRKTIIKVMQYVIPIIAIYIGAKYIPEYSQTLTDINGYLMLFICYVEVTSIFENLYEIDSKSPIAKYLYKPALKILKFGLHNNEVAKAADNIDKKPTDETTN